MILVSEEGQAKAIEVIRPYLGKAKMWSLGKRIKGSWRYEQSRRRGFRWFEMVPGVIILPRFKVLEFEKYSGVECLKTQLARYRHEMVGHARDEEIKYTYLQILSSRGNN